MGGVFVTMDYASQPAFVTCAVLEFTGDFQTAIKRWKDQELGDESAMALIYKKWFECCLVWLMDSSCTPTALQLLESNEPPNVSSQEVFIGKSTRYPFLQQWLVLLSRMGLPSRQRTFAVLAEQDDVMVEVLNGLTRMAALAGAGVSMPKQWNQRIAWASDAIEILTTEYDPDLLFADLVDTLGRDHIVLLDLLVSNETQMLEYTMRYLRHLSAHWKTSKQKLQANNRLECVMSVLIRLRLEIDKLVAADLFPYSAGPLTRRLLFIEQLYEEGSGDDAER
ncbi:hypothetical protein PHYSODRAFT_498888 [Phytophthora sojae]|uniref:Uncharacterized protein n=1 Tax=Phytophthora sojae (strain P6497) TaxID=1094619 RepID=G4ZDF6_PHYSP|nr:hypothetical protein PHYSODRAFT_498888 [Phytophthora sojae]EGZ17391.1 hypothetical protein PHYSODRAFT_498888 [Phytophthora sojae]|eukprot:XP_009526449.1 hypothetical protein PHYSODRAFT_498888 [Phytophthora sojae]